jgi:DNA-binding response OmpR family regulator
MKKILVIDDDQGVVSILQKRLEANGYEVKTAADGVNGQKLVHSFEPDLIILDVVMPGLDGYSLYQELRSEFNIRMKPVIVLTGKSEMGELFKMEGAGVVISKPFKMEDLLQEVSRLLGQ